MLEVLVIASGSAPGRPVWVALHLGYFWGTAYWEAAILRCALDAFDGERPAVGRVFRDQRLVARFLALKLILLPAVLAGLALLVVPGLLIASRFGLAPFDLVDRSSGPRAALARSRRLSRGRTRRLVGLLLVLLLFNALGAAILGLGLLLTVPMTALAGAYVFRTVTDPGAGRRR